MATKWKIYKRKRITKLSAFILLIVFLLIAVSSALNIFLQVKNYESITVKSYMDSNTLSNSLTQAANRLEFVMRVYKNRDYILGGGTVEDLQIEDNWQLTNLYNNYLAENNYEDTREIREKFYEEKHLEIEEIKSSIINADLANYEKIINELNAPQGFIYYATDGTNEITNTNNPDKDYYLLRNAYVVIDEKGVTLYPENGSSTFSDVLIEKLETDGGYKNTKIYAAIEDESLALRAEKWNADRKILITNTAIIGFCLIISITCLSLLISVTGRTPDSTEVKLVPFDKLYTDLNILVIFGIITMCRKEFYTILDIRYTSENLMRLAVVVLTAIISSLILILLLSLIRHLKKGTLFKNSLLYYLLSRTISTIAKVISSGPLMYKVIGGVILLVGTSVYFADKPFLILVILATSIYIAYNKVADFQRIQEGLKIAKSGDYDFKIQLKGKGEFRQLSEDINEITSGLKIAVENEVKSEKMKTELITNVSHDIKTPLTSIVSYVDLLKREGLNSENASKYLDILERKTHRLKILTEDLFEAAKATSGNIQVQFERVHVNSLVEQLLGELDEKIQESKLIFKVIAQSDKIYAKADGNLLSRVMENLLSNILKYALKESRVYIEISQKEDTVSISFKNISACELNIPVDELMERFKRGDESRSSEGSGLGLAIAKSLMEVQGGILDISIDGDLFKAEILLKSF